MIYLSIILFVLLASFIGWSCYSNKGLPELISDFYYLGAKWRFSAIIITVALGMMIAILDSEKGIQALAFLGCGGLMFVGAAPSYLDKEISSVHKIGAVVAAVGCIGWCLSACAVPTAVLAIAYSLYALEGGKKLWSVVELAAFLDTFITYWIIV